MDSDIPKITSPPKSLKWNTLVNFLGLIYVTCIGIIFLPLFLQYLGPEAFGLVGFFTVLNAWMQLLDMGVSPMLGRHAALASSKENGFLELKKILRSIELLVFAMAVAVFLIIAIGRFWITNYWLNVESLDLSKVAMCVIFMGAIIGLRFFSSLYRSGVQGLENQVRLNIANMILATLKFGGALLLLMYITHDFLYFFAYQLLIAIIEMAALACMFYSLMPTKEKIGLNFFWRSLKPTLPFAGGIAYSAAIWVLLTQFDKVLLSTILPLAEFGYFALAAVISAGILQISSPISQAILPRMTALLNAGKERDMLDLYSKSTQWTAVLVIPITGMVAVFSYELMFAWTGNKTASEWVDPILFWFTLGNGIMALNAFQYYLLYAHGKLKIHVIFGTVTTMVHIPLIAYAAFNYGALGAAIGWFVIRLISFAIWTPAVHALYAPSISRSWLMKDVAPSFICTCAFLYLFSNLEINFFDLGRIEIFITLIGLGSTIVLANVVASSATRRSLLATLVKTSQ